MIPILLLILSVQSQSPEIQIEQIPFRTMESCEAAAKKLEIDLSQFNVRAICIDRSTEKP